MNLLELVQGQLSSSLGPIGKLLGESEGAVKSSIGAALPAVLGSVISKGATEQGAGALLNMIKDSQSKGALFDNVGGMVSKLSSGGAGALSGLTSGIGGSLLSGIFGGKLGGLGDIIGKLGGLKAGSATALIGMLAPLVMGMIGKHASSTNLNPAGLAGFLGGQAGLLKNAVPPQIASAIGLGDMLKGVSLPNVMGQATQAARSATQAVQTAATGSGSKLPWLLVPLLAVGAYFWFTRTGAPKLPEAFAAFKPTAGSIAEKIKNAIVGNSKEEISLPTNWFADKASELSAEGKSSLAELASVLKVAPASLKATLTAYAGDEAGKTQAMQRAEALKKTLTDAGIDAARINAQTKVEAGKSGFHFGFTH